MVPQWCDNRKKPGQVWELPLSLLSNQKALTLHPLQLAWPLIHNSARLLLETSPFPEKLARHLSLSGEPATASAKQTTPQVPPWGPTTACPCAESAETQQGPERSSQASTSGIQLWSPHVLPL